MAFLEKPGWYGVPVLVRENTRAAIRAVALAIGAALVFALLAAIAGWGSADSPPSTPLQVFFMTLTFIGLFAGWFVAAFFFFRLFVNMVKLRHHRSGSVERWSIRSVFDPLYALRDQNLTEEGVRLRGLAVEGLIGFLSVQALVWLLFLASKAVGLDLTQ